MLDGRDAKRNLRACFPTDRKPYASCYDYENDSDLEEDDDEDIPDDEPATDAPQVATEQSRNDSDVIPLKNSDAKRNESSEVASVSDLDPLSPDPPDPKGEAETPSSVHVGTVLVVEDVAFVT